MVERKAGKLTTALCPQCGTTMDKVVAYVCSRCGQKTKK